MSQTWTTEKIREFFETHQAEGWVPADQRPGRVVCIEGMDGVGKSTALRHAMVYLHRSGLLAYATHERYFRISAPLRKLTTARHREDRDLEYLKFFFKLQFIEQQEVTSVVRPLISEIPCLVVLDRSFLTPITQCVIDGLMVHERNTAAQDAYQFIGEKLLGPVVDRRYDLPDVVYIALDDPSRVGKIMHIREPEKSEEMLREEAEFQRQVWEWISRACPRVSVIDLINERVPLLYCLWDALESYRAAAAATFDARYPAYASWRHERAWRTAVEVETDKRLYPWMIHHVHERLNGKAVLLTDSIHEVIRKQKEQLKAEVEREFEGRSF